MIEFLRIAARPFIFTASAVPAAVGATLAAVRICRSDEGRELFAKVLDNAAYLRSGLARARLPGAADRRTWPTAREIVTPVVPVVVGDDWKAVFLWKALYEAGVFVNVAIHPAVPPARRAAAHERDGDPRPRDARSRRSTIFAQAKRAFEAEHGPLPASD